MQGVGTSGGQSRVRHRAARFRRPIYVENYLLGRIPVPYLVSKYNLNIIVPLLILIILNYVVKILLKLIFLIKGDFLYDHEIGAFQCAKLAGLTKKLGEMLLLYFIFTLNL